MDRNTYTDKWGKVINEGDTIQHDNGRIYKVRRNTLIDVLDPKKPSIMLAMEDRHKLMKTSARFIPNTNKEQNKEEKKMEKMKFGDKTGKKDSTGKDIKVGDRVLYKSHYYKINDECLLYTPNGKVRIELASINSGDITITPKVGGTQEEKKSVVVEKPAEQPSSINQEKDLTDEELFAMLTERGYKGTLKKEVVLTA